MKNFLIWWKLEKKIFVSRAGYYLFAFLFEVVIVTNQFIKDAILRIIS